MEGNDSRYVVFVANKFIGRSKPVIIVCYNTSSSRHWTGRWIVITDDNTQCTMSKDFGVQSDGDYELNEVFSPEWLIGQMASYAEGFFCQELQTKHPALWTRLFESDHPPRFLRLDEAEGKSAIFRILFVGQKSAIDPIKEFGLRCGNKELAKLIEVAG